MRRLTSGVLVAALFGLTCVGCKSKEQTEAEKKAREGELANLQGKWRLVSRDGAADDPEAAHDGDRATPDKGDIYTIEQDVLTRPNEGDVERFRLTLYPDKNPKQVDMVLIDENGQPIKKTEKTRATKKKKARTKTADVKRAGIYKVEGATLTICFSYDGKNRPTDFNTANGSNRGIWVLQKDSETLKTPPKSEDAAEGKKDKADDQPDSGTGNKSKGD